MNVRDDDWSVSAFAILQGRETKTLLKGAGEIWQVTKAGFFSNLGDGFLGTAKQVSCHLQTIVFDISNEAGTGQGMKQSGKVIGGVVDEGSGLLYGNVLGIVVLHIVDHPLDLGRALFQMQNKVTGAGAEAVHMVQDGIQAGLYHQFIGIELFTAVLDQIIQMRGQQNCQFILAMDVYGDCFGVVCDALEVFFTAAAGAVFQQTEIEQDVEVVHRLIVELLDGMKHFGSNQHHVAGLCDILVGLHSDDAPTAHDIDDLHLTVPVYGIVR